MTHKTPSSLVKLHRYCAIRWLRSRGSERSARWFTGMQQAAQRLRVSQSQQWQGVPVRASTRSRSYLAGFQMNR